MSVMDMWSVCDRCGWIYRRRDLRAESTGWVVCPKCHDGRFDRKNHPQNFPPPFRKEPSLVPDGRQDYPFWIPPPINQYDFRNGSIPTNFMTFARGSHAFAFNSVGQLSAVAASAPRLDYSPNSLQFLGLRLHSTAVTNLFTNPYALGAVAGSPGTLPTDWWSTGPSSGISRQVIGRGIEDGIPYVDIRYTGTPTTNATFAVNSNWNLIPATAGETIAVVGAWRRVGGTTSGMASPLFGIIQNQNVSVLMGLAISVPLPTSSPLRTQIYSVVQTTTAVAMDNVGLRFRTTFLQGQSIDVTIRYALLVLAKTSAVPDIIMPATESVGVSVRAAESATLSIPSAYSQVEVLRQDVNGVSWTVETVTGGSIPVTPRAGQNHLLRFAAWPAYMLMPGHKTHIEQST